VARLGGNSRKVLQPQINHKKKRLIIEISTVILFLSHRHDAKFGPKSAHARDAEKIQTVDSEAV